MDRNFCGKLQLLSMTLSLSARRAWIEIQKFLKKVLTSMSLSARRAWIEISGVDFAEDWLNAVALRKESVDRNCYLDNIEITEASRSPQGERG